MKRKILFLLLSLLISGSAAAQEVYANIYRKAGDVVTLQVAENQKISFSSENPDDCVTGSYYGPMVDFGGGNLCRVVVNDADPAPSGSELAQELNGHRYVLSANGGEMTITDYVIASGSVSATIGTGLSFTPKALQVVPDKRTFVISCLDGTTTRRVDVELTPFAYDRNAAQTNVVNITKADGTTFTSNVDALDDLYYTDTPMANGQSSMINGQWSMINGAPIWFGEGYCFKRKPSTHAPDMAAATKSQTLNGTTYTLASNGVITFGSYSIATGIANASKMFIDADSRRFVIANTGGTCYDIVFADSYVYAPTANTANTNTYLLTSADWGWQTQGTVTYGKATFAGLYNSTQTIAIAKYPEAQLSAAVYNVEGSTKGTDGLAAQAGAAVAINGSYFNMSTNRSITALWVNGTEIATTDSGEKARCTGIVGFKNGQMSMWQYNADTNTATDLANWGSQYDSFLATGPLLRLGGTSMTNVKTGSSSFDGVNPRSMIGKTQDGTVYMVVVEGRIAKADGLRIENMVNLAEDLGLVDAINLDGGGSSTLWVNGVGVVNRLSGGSVRRVPNILIAK